MKWNKYRLKIKEEAEDIVIAALADTGIQGVEIEDKAPLTESDKKQMFVDILPDLPDDDGIAYLSFYLDVDEDNEAILAKARAALDDLKVFSDIGDCTLEKSETEDKDWINNWKKYFHQFYVDDILIIPSWEEVKEEDRDKMILHIDPGTAFGTGMHETTQLCIRAIRNHLHKGDRVLDIGTGSGILAITALKLGAGHAEGTDLDPESINAVADNKEANKIQADDFNVCIGNLIDDKDTQDKIGYEKYDLVCANILAEILVDMAPAAARTLKKGGIYITSGILDGKQDMVIKAGEEAGLKLMEVNRQNDWVGVVFTK
ncbi:MAG: 50S ribosomal protein L11 methyltransferase [Eubacterium sp.]|nr:50S ribosomal protein L11 methyltransferase [Eubacterium sp.]